MTKIDDLRQQREDLSKLRGIAYDWYVMIGDRISNLNAEIRPLEQAEHNRKIR